MSGFAYLAMERNISTQLSIGEPVEWVGRLSMEEIGSDSAAMFCIDIR